MPDLTFTQPHPGSYIEVRLGNHLIGDIYPPSPGCGWRWTMWLPTEHGIGTKTISRAAKTEQAAKNALLAEARDWLRRAGVE